MSDKEYEYSIDSIISNGTTIEGEIHSQNPLRIDGVVKGSIYNNRQIIIGETGEVCGDIFAKLIIIGGKVIGNVSASEKIEILSSSDLQINVFTPRLFVEEGTNLNSYCYLHNSFLEKDYQEFINYVKKIIINLNLQNYSIMKSAEISDINNTETGN